MSKKTRTIVILLLAVALFGCSKGLEKNTMSAGSFLELTPSTTPDLTQPEVSAYSPTGTGIGLSTKISVKFSEAMLQSTISSSTFQVTTGVTPVPGRVSYNILTKTYTFTPDSKLAYNTGYTVTVSGTVTDKAGNTLEGGDYTWTFTTQDTTMLPTPEFTPISGTYDSNTVTITYTGPAANIYFTTNSTDPSPTNGTLYDGNPISISVNSQIRAIACENPGYYDSNIATGDFYFHSDQPSFSEASGTYHYDISIDIIKPLSDPLATIYYEITFGTTLAPPPDPPTPTTASAGYTGPIDITGDFTVVKITAIAVSTGKCDSIPLTVTYTIDYYQTGTPTFSVNPADGPFDTPQSVIISHDPGSTLIYTLDGSDPTDPMNPNLQTTVSTPIIDVSETTVITAYAIMSGWRDSAVYSGTFVINPSIDYIDPNAVSNSESNLSALIRGARFDPAATVSLNYGASRIDALTTSWVDSTALQCTFDLTGATTGYWSVTVTNPEGTTTLVDGFRIYTEPAGIVSWWKLNSNALDSVGPNEGTNSGGVSYTADRFGTAGSAAVNSSMSDYIDATATGLPAGSSPRTMMGWFRLDFIHTGENFLFGYGNGTKYFKIFVNSLTNRLVLSDDGADIVTGNTVLTTGRWYHVAATYDGTTAKLYLDGMIEGSADATFATSTTAMYLFKVDALFPWLNGALDDVMVLNTTLTQAEVQQVTANGGYLLPPVNLQASKTFVNQIVLTWDPVLDATDYDVYRETSLAGAFVTPLNVSPITDATYTDTDISPSTLYFYKVRARNAARTSALTKAEVGYTTGTLTTLTEGFEWVFASWWDIAPTQPVVTGSTGASFGTTPAQYDGNSQMTVASATACTGGCNYTESLALTKTFGTPISYFTLSLYYIYTPGTDVGGNFSVYVNNVDPSDDPANGLVPFAQPLITGGWRQRNLFYIGNNDINSITIIFYDITDTAEFNADLLRLNYK